MVMNPKNHPTLENRYVMLFVVQSALLGGYLILGEKELIIFTNEPVEELHHGYLNFFSLHQIFFFLGELWLYTYQSRFFDCLKIMDMNPENRLPPEPR